MFACCVGLCAIYRDAEIRRMVRVLCRRTKNNPVLIGEPGVGKVRPRSPSAIVVLCLHLLSAEEATTRGTPSALQTSSCLLVQPSYMALVFVSAQAAQLSSLPHGRAYIKP